MPSSSSSGEFLEVATDVPISEPYFFPAEELVLMGGLSWTQERGMVVETPMDYQAEGSV